MKDIAFLIKVNAAELLITLIYSISSSAARLVKQMMENKPTYVPGTD